MTPSQASGTGIIRPRSRREQNRVLPTANRVAAMSDVEPSSLRRKAPIAARRAVGDARSRSHREPGSISVRQAHPTTPSATRRSCKHREIRISSRVRA